MKLNKNVIAFTGGGTAGHIYPGLAVADELKALALKDNTNISINWIGCSKGMDSQIVQKGTGSDGKPTADAFYGIPSGKLRRYLSKLHLCFLSNNDITGGNSGSPMFNGKGELIGLAFDGNWDSLSSDIFFDSQLARCIGVDIRYVLYMMEKWGKADRLLQEINAK